MAGRPTRQHISRFAQWERPTAYADSAVRECSVKGASVLKHTAGDSRAVAETRNRLTGARIVLCADCLTICREDVWKNAGKTWITGDGTISRGNETICPLVEMVRIEDLSSGEWIRQGANVWQVSTAYQPDRATRLLELQQGPATYKVRMNLATMVERVQPTEEQ